jgi:hypothetical protein
MSKTKTLVLAVVVAAALSCVSLSGSFAGFCTTSLLPNTLLILYNKAANNSGTAAYIGNGVCLNIIKPGIGEFNEGRWYLLKASSTKQEGWGFLYKTTPKPFDCNLTPGGKCGS